MNRIVGPADGWAPTPGATAGASLTRPGRTYVSLSVSPCFLTTCAHKSSSPHQAYTFDPLANLTAAQAPLVLGGQQLLWTEQSGPQNLDPIVWPRAAASAEVFWSGPGGNVSAALPRLHELGYRFRNRGVQAIPLQPEWCALRPGVCDLTA